MYLLKKFLERKIGIYLMIVLIFIVGVYSINELDRELMPSVDFDMAVISVGAGDMPALDVEDQITKPVEQLLAGTDGVESYESTSSVGESSVFVEIEEGKTAEVVRELETGVNQLESELTAVQFTDVFSISTDQNYEFYMEISAGTLNEISDFALDVVEPRLEALDEVRDVNLSGVEETEYIITFDRDELNEAGLDLNQAIQSLQQSDMDMSLGELREEENQPSLRWNTSIASLDDIENAAIPTADGSVSISDLADISAETDQLSSMGWKDGSRDIIFVEIGRANGYTQVEMAEAVRAEVDKINEEGLASDLSFTEIVAEADYVSSSIDSVTQNVLIGGILAIGVLLLLLRNFRATIIIGLTIPVSLMLTFASMWLFGYSLNVLTLIGLGLGVGMMIDAAIVILESVYRKKEQGYTGKEAVLAGTKEVTSPIIASMLTTVAVFLPVGLLGGDFAIFILVLSVVVVMTLLSSVIVSFTLIPALAENFLKLRNRDKGQQAKESRIIAGYGRIVKWLTLKKRRRYGMIFLFILMFAGSMALTVKVPFTLMPDVLDRYTEVGLQLESGLTASEKDTVVRAAEENLASVPDIESAVFLDSGDYLYALINLTKENDITTPQDEINLAVNDALRELEEEYPVTGIMSMDGSGGQPVQLHVQGEDLAELESVSDRLADELTDIDGLVNVNTSMENQTEERQMVFDREALEDDGLSTSDIYGQLQGLFSTVPVGEIVENGVAVPVTAQLNETVESEDTLQSFDIVSAAGTKSMSEYVQLEPISSPAKIERRDGERYAAVSGELEGRDLGAVSRDVQSILDRFDLPHGYTVSIAGDMEAQQDMIIDLAVVMGIALFLVYAVMAVQFNSLVHPLIVMSVIPMISVGGVLALLLTQRELSVLSALALLLLTGIVLNNAILLIDRVKQLRKSGMKVNQAIVEAGKNRFRPIFLTTLTTVAGMMPLAVAPGTANAYQAPLATVIIGGLFFATLITLILVPSVYLFTEDVRRGIKRLFRKEQTANSDVRKAS